MLAVQAENAAVVKLLLKHHADVNIHSYGARVPSLHHIHILHGVAMHSLCHQAMLHVPPASASISFLCQQQQRKFIKKFICVIWVCKQWYQITHSLLTLANPAQAQLAFALLLCCCNVFLLLHCIHAFAL